MDYIRMCEVCQTKNDAKFVKEAAPLDARALNPSSRAVTQKP